MDARVKPAHDAELVHWLYNLTVVIAGLDPAIHEAEPQTTVDCKAVLRFSSSWLRGSSPRMTRSVMRGLS
jgi:hypothetical protein